MRWTDGEREPSFKKSETNRHLPKIEVRHMSIYSTWKEMAA